MGDSIEIWKNINERYQVSNMGNIRSVDFSSGIDNRKRIRFKKGKNLKSSKRNDGYFVVNISRFRHKRNWKIHQLVAIHFLPNPNNFKVINHKNGIKTDNRSENLEWCTQQENSQHAYSVLKRNPVRNNGLKNGYSKPVIDLMTGVFYESASELSKIIGIKRTTLTAQLSGQNKNKTKFQYA